MLTTLRWGLTRIWPVSDIETAVMPRFFGPHPSSGHTYPVNFDATRHTRTHYAIETTGGGRIPVIGRVGDGARPVDDGGLRELSEDVDDKRPEHELYDFSIGASIRSNAMAWRQLTELKGAIIASPESAGRDHALKLIDLFDAWLESSDDRLQLMLERRNKDGGAS